jgi:hypothetical protein
MRAFNTLFAHGKPVLGMLHLAGDTPQSRVATALQEAQMMSSAGFDGVIVENYFGTNTDVEVVLAELTRMNLPCKIGLNVLGGMDIAFDLAALHAVDFIQVDRVCGHLPPAQDGFQARHLAARRADCGAVLLGGVRFKYMPVLSGRSEAEDLEIGRERCDAIVVTSDATGHKTDLAKIRRFRAVLGPDYPLIVGAGLRPDNVAEQFAIADGGIVGSWLKDHHRDSGMMNADYVETFIKAARGHVVDRGVAP